jgi:hypothetical protein
MDFCEEAVTGCRGRGFGLLEGWRVIGRRNDLVLES